MWQQLERQSVSVWCWFQGGDRWQNSLPCPQRHDPHWSINTGSNYPFAQICSKCGPLKIPSSESGNYRSTLAVWTRRGFVVFDRFASGYSRVTTFNKMVQNVCFMWVKLHSHDLSYMEILSLSTHETCNLKSGTTISNSHDECSRSLFIWQFKKET